MRKPAAPALILLLLLAGCGQRRRRRWRPAEGRADRHAGLADDRLRVRPGCGPGPRQGRRTRARARSTCRSRPPTTPRSRWSKARAEVTPRASRRTPGPRTSPEALIVAKAKEAGALDPSTRTSGSAPRSCSTPSRRAARPTTATTWCSAARSPAPDSSRSRSTTGCRPAAILGDEGEVFVKAGTAISPEVWYSVTCQRAGSEVSISVTQYGEQGQTWTAAGPTGHITLGELPLAVGGKVSNDGLPVALRGPVQRSVVRRLRADRVPPQPVDAHRRRSTRVDPQASGAPTPVRRTARTISACVH